MELDSDLDPDPYYKECGSETMFGVFDTTKLFHLRLKRSGLRTVCTYRGGGGGYRLVYLPSDVEGQSPI